MARGEDRDLDVDLETVERQTGKGEQEVLREEWS